MDSDRGASVDTTSVPDSPAGSVEETQLDHATPSPQTNVKVEDLSPVSAVGEQTTPEDAATPLIKLEEDDDVQFSTTEPLSQSTAHTDGTDNSSMAENPTTPIKDSIETRLSASQEDPGTPTPTPATPRQPTIAVDTDKTPKTAKASTAHGKEAAGTGTVSVTPRKRPRSPTPPTGGRSTISEALRTLQRDYVLLSMTENLKKAWQDVVERCGMRLGSREAFNTRFEPDTDQVRDAALALPPNATLDHVADAVEAVMLDQWKITCKNTITRYRRDFRRSLVAEAQDQARAVRQHVLANARNVGSGRDVEALALSLPTPRSTPSPPHTPTRGTRFATGLGLGLGLGMDGLRTPFRADPSVTSSPAEISGAGPASRTPTQPRVPDLRLDGRMPATPVTSTPRTANKRVRVPAEPVYQPRAFSTPRRSYGMRLGPGGDRDRAMTPAPRWMAALAETPVRTTAVRGGVVGRLGRYSVTRPRPRPGGSEFEVLAGSLEEDGDVFTSTG
ncbi:hypothetical protein GGR54DRAFT_123555 [Hypoxylon sp. NC1633]|nr:hypothetical protein GGR54DRAFT_123555 [Hypoxylon sp. NC1633]